MGCDMVMAVGQATGQQGSLVGVNEHGTPPRNQVRRWPRKTHAADESIRLGMLELPQMRETCAVLGSQPQGAWGLSHGLNELGLALGVACWQSKLPAAEGLRGTDLVRLTLERSHSARHAVDVLTDLIGRHGQGTPGEQGDHVFFLVDSKEAFVVEAAGKYWAMLQCQQVRAVSDVGLIRQDWRRLAPGLAEHAIAQGWWPDDGSKLDVGCLAGTSNRQAGPLKRWGKATVLLEQQNGHIDHYFLRRLLADHFDQHARTPDLRGRELLATFIGVLSASAPYAWFGLNRGGVPLYLPMFPQGDLPLSWQQQEASYAVRSMQREEIEEMMERLQHRIDQETEDFLLRTSRDNGDFAAQASALMQRHWDMLQNAAMAEKVTAR